MRRDASEIEKRTGHRAVGQVEVDQRRVEDRQLVAVPEVHDRVGHGRPWSRCRPRRGRSRSPSSAPSVDVDSGHRCAARHAAAGVAAHRVRRHRRPQDDLLAGPGVLDVDGRCLLVDLRLERPDGRAEVERVADRAACRSSRPRSRCRPGTDVRSSKLAGESGARPAVVGRRARDHDIDPLPGRRDALPHVTVGGVTSVTTAATSTSISISALGRPSPSTATAVTFVTPVSPIVTTAVVAVDLGLRRRPPRRSCGSGSTRRRCRCPRRPA